MSSTLIICHNQNYVRFSKKLWQFEVIYRMISCHPSRQYSEQTDFLLCFSLSIYVFCSAWGCIAATAGAQRFNRLTAFTKQNYFVIRDVMTCSRDTERKEFQSVPALVATWFPKEADTQMQVSTWIGCDYQYSLPYYCISETAGESEKCEW